MTGISGRLEVNIYAPMKGGRRLLSKGATPDWREQHQIEGSNTRLKGSTPDSILLTYTMPAITLQKAVIFTERGYCSGNALNSYSGGTQFESRLGPRLPKVFRSVPSSLQATAMTLTSQFITNPISRHCVAWATEVVTRATPSDHIHAYLI
jgi:hypothetical protein